MGPIDCSETSVLNQHTLLKKPEDGRIQLKESSIVDYHSPGRIFVQQTMIRKLALSVSSI
jgi:hypothetical protein